MELILILAFVESIMKYGVPAALQIFRDWEIENPTLADIEALRLRIKKPEEYFKEPETNG